MAGEFFCLLCSGSSHSPTANVLTVSAIKPKQQAQALDDAPEWTPDEAEMIDLEEQDIAARCKAIHDALETWTPEQIAHAGVIVTKDGNGDVEVIRGLVRDED